MSELLKNHAEELKQFFGDKVQNVNIEFGEITIEVSPDDVLEVSAALCDTSEFAYEQLIDICGVDYSQLGQVEWQTNQSSNSGFSRGVDEVTMGRLTFSDDMEFADVGCPRFASVMHLLSYSNNRRLRVRVFAEDDDFPMIPSVTGIWSSANWFERESFDLFGILYSDHPDLRRILTDYGFVGHPFRKDFPLVGHVEMRYDPEQKRVIYEPVSIEPRVLVPRVKRDDHRYLSEDNNEVTE